MKKTYLFVILLFVTLLTISCTRLGAERSRHTDSISPSSMNAIPEPMPLTFHEEYIALVESYIDDVSFQQMDGSRTKQLSDMLMGHYDIIGRTTGNGMDYYLAIRRMDAPVYDDFSSIDIGYFSEAGAKSEVLQIGYYDKDIDSNILYEIEGYDLLELPLGNENLNCFCFSESKSSDEYANQTFILAFTEHGRTQLDFIRKNAGLSLYRANSPCIEFYYQDDDTLKFYSSPYSCFISISGDELEEIITLFSASKVVDNVKSPQEAWKYMHVKDSSIRSTGARLHIDGKQYEFLGNSNSAGYIMSTMDEQGFIVLEFNEAVYSFVMDKIKNVMKIDYGSFDAQWFKIPLKSASIDFPERVEQVDGSYITDLRSQTVNDPEKLNALSKLMDRAINSEEIYGFSGCPYIASIKFTREDGKILRVFIATDSCDSMTYDGRIGFEYGKQSDMAEIFDEAMADRLIN
ncbi:hypothetical protein EDD66_103335 [Mobilisporobacter senegalensis]|uniref:DUF4340 domain-containing protein n=1 Tax=Mobilisporobacter senegalensis TaxID=1329262 RepID=A0A3N1XWT0_9FIRM|nr:hypothetical protein [Mobilisporobacter senegalensis]ROR29397.1 hypothetical protein EDD66_103335 [Mobilisporobacter senegalensis]